LTGPWQADRRANPFHFGWKETFTLHCKVYDHSRLDAFNLFPAKNTGQAGHRFYFAVKNGILVVDAGEDAGGGVITAGRFRGA
jgi:hypothetical protein